MSPVDDRQLFLKWLLLNVLTLAGFIALGVTEHGKIHGASRVAIPLILVAFGWATAQAGRICWVAGSRWRNPLHYGISEKKLLHDATWLGYWAYACQIMGILSTVYGFWALLAGGDHAANQVLASRIQTGGGVALLGTFVGVLTSLVLTFEHRLIEHELVTGR